MQVTQVTEVLRLVPNYRPVRRQRQARGDRQHRPHRLTVVELGHAPPNCQGRHHLQSPAPRGARVHRQWFRRRGPVEVPHLNPHALTVDGDGQLAPGARVVDDVRHQLGDHQQRVIAGVVIHPPPTAGGFDGGACEPRRLRLRRQDPAMVRLARTVARHDGLVPAETSAQRSGRSSKKTRPLAPCAYSKPGEPVTRRRLRARS
jgi:hypothetical protein